MSRSLPVRPNLEFLKTQAKELLDAFRTNDADVRQQVRNYFPESRTIGLSEAQLVLAREYGFESWTKLKAHVSALIAAPDLVESANRFVETAMRGRPEDALLLLKEEPSLGAATLSAACASGDNKAAQSFIDADPASINSKVGPKGWEPLLYVCYSRLLKDKQYRPHLVETARLLLDRGADPNAHWLNPDWDNCPESCLYGATGVNDCPELAEMLLKAGADPNDGESFYHSTELLTPECMKLLLQYGADVTDQNNALAHLLDDEKPDWLPFMLDSVREPSRIPPVFPHALRRGRSTEVFRFLIGSGMPLDTPNENGLTPYQSAARLGRRDVTALLADAGANTSLTAADTILGRLASGEPLASNEIPREVIETLNRERSPELIRQAERGNNTVLEALLAAGADPNVRDSQNAPLHLPALHGNLETIRLLLRYGADPTLRDSVHDGHAVGWACQGSAHFKAASPEAYVRVVETLLDAGGMLPETAWGSPEVQAALVKRGAKPAAV